MVGGWTIINYIPVSQYLCSAVSGQPNPLSLVHSSLVGVYL